MLKFEVLSIEKPHSSVFYMVCDDKSSLHLSLLALSSDLPVGPFGEFCRRNLGEFGRLH